MKKVYKPRLHYNVLDTDCAWNGATFFRHGPARLHLVTGAITLIFSTARLSVYTCVKACTARLIGVPRPTYLVVLGTAKNHGCRACTVYTVRICRAVPKNSGARTKILAVSCPKRYSVNGINSVSDLELPIKHPFIFVLFFTR